MAQGQRMNQPGQDGRGPIPASPVTCRREPAPRAARRKRARRPGRVIGTCQSRYSQRLSRPRLRRVGRPLCSRHPPAARRPRRPRWPARWRRTAAGQLQLHPGRDGELAGDSRRAPTSYPARTTPGTGAAPNWWPQERPRAPRRGHRSVSPAGTCTRKQPPGIRSRQALERSPGPRPPGSVAGI